MAPHRTRLRLSLPVLLVTALLVVACGGTDEAPPPPPSSAAAAPPPAAPSPPPPAAAAGSSVVAGSIVFEGDVPNLKPISMDADPGCAAKHDGPVAPEVLVLGEGQSLGNVFVQVTNAPVADYAPPAEPAVIDQNGCIYHPHVIGLVAGQKLIFRNSDGLLHNVHGLPKENREFNMGMPPAVTESEAKLTRPEPLFPVKCDVHPWMRSYVAVLGHPYFAVTDDSGAFRIEGLPAGTYQIEAWHERLGTREASVTVGDGEAGTADFTFTVPPKG